LADDGDLRTMIAAVTDWILGLHGWVALAVVFLFPALEASVFLGFVFPGEIAVILGGVLAFEGRIPLWAAILASVLGAFVGDTIGFEVGRRWGNRFIGHVERLPLVGRHARKHVDSARDYLSRKGGRAVVIGRFTAAFRVMVPGLAGMSEIPYVRFAAFNLAGAAVWGTTFVLLGFVAGAAWHRVADIAGLAGVALVAILLIALVAGRIVRRVRAGDLVIGDRLASARPVAWFRKRHPDASAWLARRIDASSARGFLLTVVVVAGGLCAWLFGGLTQDVVANEEAVHLDPGITRFLVDHRVAWLDTAMRTLTWLGSNVVLIPLIAALAIYLLVRRRSAWGATLAVAALAGAIVLYNVVKPIVARPRPPVADHLMTVSSFSFPSGHATASMACYGMVAALLAAHHPLRGKLIAGVLAALVVVLVAFSRVYLGLHWFTDVVAGVALGGLWLCVLWTIAILSGVPRESEGTTSEPTRTSSERAA
jgi:membrane protein DedA with SNARE-associated domain/membrane-associated phospholipid phosphatase